jgi:transposase InsO family protein
LRQLGLGGVLRNRKGNRTTCPTTAVGPPPDLVTPRFAAKRPNQLWVAGLTYAATWREFAYVALVIEVFACRIVVWRVSSSLPSDLTTIDALEQSLVLITTLLGKMLRRPVELTLEPPIIVV